MPFNSIILVTDTQNIIDAIDLCCETFFSLWFIKEYPESDEG